jgi:hypothetical protein
MAGLLDIFGTGGADTMGLLGMSPADIARNRDDAQAQALYALAGRLFQGGNTGQSIAEGLQLGQKAYKGGMSEAMQSQLQNFQLQELLRKREEDKAKRQLEQQALMRQQGIESEITKAYRPQTFADTPLTNIMGQEIAGPNQPQEAGLGLEALAPKLMGSPEGRKALNELLAAQKAMGGETTSLAEGAKLIRVNPITGKVETVAEGAPKREPVPTEIAQYNLAKSQGFEGTFIDFEKSKKGFTYQDVGNAIIQLDSSGKEVSRIPKGRAPEGPVSFQSVETDQGLMAFNPKTMQMTPIMGADGKPITKTGKATVDETNAAGFASRMVYANSITSKLATGIAPKFGEAVLGVVPLIGKAIPEVIPQGVGGLSPERRQYLQAANNFIRANLRKESGAAIGADEWTAEFINYFPQYNDDAQTIKQKEIFRNILTQNMVAAGGKSYKAPNMTAPESMTNQYDLSPRLSNSLRGGR